jgi:hypothetical protein
MDGVERVYDTGVTYAKDRYYPTSFRHFVYIAIYFLITYYVTDYFLDFRLIRWIYLGTLVVIVATLLVGPKKDMDPKERERLLFRVGERAVADFL